MQTVFDWVAVGLFAGLVVLFLERSSKDVAGDSLWQYMIAAVGCAVANQLGNNGYPIAGWLTIVAVIAFIVRVLRPFEGWKR